MTPFGARFVIEVIRTPYPLKPTRPSNSTAKLEDFYNIENGGGANKTTTTTTYVHVTLSQRTIPLYKSYTQCARRDDGWCELVAFLDALKGLLESARYEFACFGTYGLGNVTDGAPALGRRGEEGGNLGRPGFVLGRGMGSGLASSAPLWAGA